MKVGYNKPLYVLPFDHRGSFQKNMFGYKSPLTAEQTAEIAAAKQVIYDAFKAAVAGGVPKDQAAILVDEQFGAAILATPARTATSARARPRRAARMSSILNTARTSASTSKSSSRPSARCLCATTRGADKAMNQRQTARLKQLSDWLHSHDKLYMFELLVPPEPDQLGQIQR